MNTDQRKMEQQMIGAVMRYQLDLTLATNSLLYILYGINLVHRQANGSAVNSFPVPDYPPLKVIPQVVAMNSPFSERTAPRRIH